MAVSPSRQIIDHADPPPRGFTVENLSETTCSIRYLRTVPIGRILFTSIWLFGLIAGSGYFAAAALRQNDLVGTLLMGAFVSAGLLFGMGLLIGQCRIVTCTISPEALLLVRDFLGWRRQRNILREQVTAVRRDNKLGDCFLTVMAGSTEPVLQYASSEQVDWLARVLVRWSGVALTSEGGGTAQASLSDAIRPGPPRSSSSEISASQSRSQ